MPLTQSFSYRQVFTDVGERRRIESFNAVSGQLQSVQIFDGERYETLSDLKHRGTIEKPRLEYVGNGRDYAMFYRNIAVKFPFGHILGQRTGVICQTERDSGLLKVSVPFGGKDLPKYAWRLWFDPSRGLALIKNELFKRTLDSPFCRTEVGNKLHEIEPGVWAPTDIVVSYFNAKKGTPHFGEITEVLHSVVDVTRSKWNTEPADSEFEMTFPAGTRIADQEIGMSFVTGKANAGSRIDELVKNARDKVAIVSFGPQTPELPHSPTTRILLWLNIIVILGLMVLYLVRRHGRKRLTHPS